MSDSTETIAGAKIADSCCIVIFGSSGDLTKRKLIPALYNLAKAELLPKDFAIIGFARRDGSSEKLRETFSNDIKEFATSTVDDGLWKWIEERIYYVQGELGDGESYAKLRTQLEEVDATHNTKGNYLFYLATPPGFFSEIVSQLGEAGLSREGDGQWRRVVIEKPFGRDLDSAKELNRSIQGVLNENQIYRIDHYLGKETVQNLMVLRFANGIFEPLWNRRYIDHVQITVAETVGVEDRGSYYDGAGALRDMVQNHLFQLLALIAMEPPSSFEADAVRDEKSKVLDAVRRFDEEEVLKHSVRGQYGEGTVQGKTLSAYRNEPNVDPASMTDTFVALELGIDNWRWADVPFYLRTGKALPLRSTEIAIQFRTAPHNLFRNTAIGHDVPNQLVIHIQPDEGVSLSFQVKVPGQILSSQEVQMDFCYSEHFGQEPTTGYETLLYDCMCGDGTLFQRADTVEISWEVLTPVLDVWGALPARDFPNYKAGSWGPNESEELLTKNKRIWRNPS